MCRPVLPLHCRRCGQDWITANTSTVTPIRCQLLKLLADIELGQWWFDKWQCKDCCFGFSWKVYLPCVNTRVLSLPKVEVAYCQHAHWKLQDVSFRFSQSILPCQLNTLVSECVLSLCLPLLTVACRHWRLALYMTAQWKEDKPDRVNHLHFLAIFDAL